MVERIIVQIKKILYASLPREEQKERSFSFLSSLQWEAAIYSLFCTV